ncbi:MAG: type II secretion system protein [Fibrobacterota bacterium]
MPEVLTVIVIVGIVSAMAVPRFMRFTATSRLEETAQILAKDMDWAKLAGTRSGVRHYVRFVPGTDTSWYEIWKENSDPVDNLFSSSDDSLLRRVAMDPAVRFGGLVTGATAAPDAPGSAMPTNGLGDGLADEDCRDDGLVPGQGSWSQVAAICGGSKAALEAGAVYLSLKNYPDMGEAIVFDDNVSFKLLKYSWRGSWHSR